jgi:Ku70/Ku80 beta-barrel domain
MPRASWNGFLRLSLVTCPVYLAPATTESKRIRFNQLNAETGNRLRQQLVDAETGEVVERDRIAKGYEYSRGQYVTVDDDELKADDDERRMDKGLVGSLSHPGVSPCAGSTPFPGAGNQPSWLPRPAPLIRAQQSAQSPRKLRMSPTKSAGFSISGIWPQSGIVTRRALGMARS